MKFEDLSMVKLDTRPGNYYVSIIEADRFGLLAGPYPLHQQALDMVEPARAKAYEVDPWSAFYGFSTCRLPADYQDPPKGKLNDLLGVK